MNCQRVVHYINAAISAFCLFCLSFCYTLITNTESPRSIRQKFARQKHAHCVKTILRITINSICQILHNVCKKEGLTIPAELSKRIAEKSNRNLRRALLMCEVCRVQQYPFSPDQPVQEADWEVYLRDTAQQIVEQQTPKRLPDE
ncbi:replication factor C subunit 3-like [Pocillopora verrucosa]|uniref:replication factor C subunit 3-like n=1 Tax=Pocillopora verrucosa TaxID=203993 RepID=UPI002797478F|nr:replication factor C subunit 3-like [Pocillopora verrucosa]